MGLPQAAAQLFWSDFLGKLLVGDFAALRFWQFPFLLGFSTSSNLDQPPRFFAGTVRVPLFQMLLKARSWCSTSWCVALAPDSSLCLGASQAGRDQLADLSVFWGHQWQWLLGLCGICMICYCFSKNTTWWNMWTWGASCFLGVAIVAFVLALNAGSHKAARCSNYQHPKGRVFLGWSYARSGLNLGAWCSTYFLDVEYLSILFLTLAMMSFDVLQWHGIWPWMQKQIITGVSL